MPQDELKEDLGQYLPSRTTADRLARGEMWKTPTVPVREAMPGPETASPRGERTPDEKRRRLRYSVIGAACVLAPIVALLVLLHAARTGGSGDGEHGSSANGGVQAAPPRASGSAKSAAASASVAPPSSSAASASVAPAPSSVASASVAPASSGPPAAGVAPDATGIAPTATATATPTAAPKPTPAPRTIGTASPAIAPTIPPASPPAPAKPQPFDPLINE